MLMKKLLLVAAGAFMAFSANAQWAVVGSYTTPDWNFQASTQLKGDGDVLSCEIEYLTTSFKIVDITNDNWDTAYGLPKGETLDINTPTELTLGGDNIFFTGALTQGVKNATVNWNPTTSTLEVVASENDLVVEYPTLYMTGGFNGWATPGTEGSVEGVEENGVYTFSVDLGSAEGVAFKVASANWATEYAGKTDGVVIGTEPVEVQVGGKDLIAGLTGEQVLVFNFEDLTMYFESDDTDGVSSINNENAPAVYYNLQGVKVNNPEKGIYIVKKGDKTYKVIR